MRSKHILQQTGLFLSLIHISVSKYEKGDISLDISTFLELSKIFKVSPLAIIGDEIAEEEEECTYAETIEKLYMYSYDGIGKVCLLYTSRCV